MPRNSCTSPPASGSEPIGSRADSRAFRVQGPPVRPVPRRLAERPQDPRRVLPVATLLAGAPGPASRSPPL